MIADHLFIVDPSPEVRTTIARKLGPDQPWTGQDSLTELAQAIDVGRVPAVVITGPGIVHDDAVMLASSVQEEGIPAALVQVTKSLEPDALRSAMRAGVADVVELDGPVDELGGAVDRALRQAFWIADRATAAAPYGPAAGGHVPATPVVALVAGKGGVGTSMLTTNLAAALAGSGHEVVAIDLDLASGDLAIMFQQRPALTVVDAVNRIDHLDQEALPGYLVDVRGHLKLLAAPLDGSREVESAPLLRLLDIVESVADIIIVDVGNGSSIAAQDVLAMADHVIMVTTREVTAIRATNLLLGELTDMGRRRATITLVANRSDESTGLAIGDVEKALDTSIDHLVPLDKMATQSVNRGEPLVDRRRSRAGDAIMDLARVVASTVDLT